MRNHFNINQGYQKKDRRIVNYNLETLGEYPIPFRGPLPKATHLETGTYFSAIGAAQTFGRFVQYSFSQILSAAIDLPCLNLGMSGAGPNDFGSSDLLINRINGGRFCIVQMMSARSVGNSAVSCPFGGLLTLRDDPTAAPKPAQQMWDEILRTRSPSEVYTLIEETQQAYVAAMRSLLARIDVPVILLWFSRRRSNQLHRVELTDSAKTLLGSFPHFVTHQMFKEISRDAKYICESASSYGMPQTLRDYRGARGLVPVYPKNPVPHENGYYPSQEMHTHCGMQLMALLNSVPDLPWGTPDPILSGRD